MSFEAAKILHLIYELLKSYLQEKNIITDEKLIENLIRMKRRRTKKAISVGRKARASFSGGQRRGAQNSGFEKNRRAELPKLSEGNSALFLWASRRSSHEDRKKKPGQSHATRPACFSSMVGHNRQSSPCASRRILAGWQRILTCRYAFSEQTRPA